MTRKVYDFTFFVTFFGAGFKVLSSFWALLCKYFNPAVASFSALTASLETTSKAWTVFLPKFFLSSLFARIAPATPATAAVKATPVAPIIRFLVLFEEELRSSFFSSSAIKFTPQRVNLIYYFFVNFQVFLNLILSYKFYRFKKGRGDKLSRK